MMALHHMNYLHWHLTDDQGWRLEIKKYPKLTKIGSYRKETVIGSKQQAQGTDAPRTYTTHKDEKKNQDNVKNDSFEIIPSESGEKHNEVNEEKNDENK